MQLDVIALAKESKRFFSACNYIIDFINPAVYEVVTITGDENGAGTDANVFVTLFGDYGITPKIHLASKSRTAFERSKTDVFRIRTHNVGHVKKIRIEHDNTGMNAGWFLDRVVITDVIRPHLRFYFACNNWLSKEEGDGLYARDLLGSMDQMDMPKYNKYIVSVFTADMKGGGTDADVFINIFGEFGDTGERRLDSDKNNFEKATEDKFTIDAPNLGKIRKITIGHNNKGSSAGWFVILDDMGNKVVYEFPINRWFALDEDDGKIQRDILVGADQPTGIIYNVQIVTGNIRGAGTNSKIHIVMHGTKGLKNSGKVFLEGGKFERGLTDIFNVEIAALLSPLSRVTIGHDNDGVSAGWYCEKVVVYCPFTGIEQTFPCGKWLDDEEGDGLIERELYEMVSLRQRRQKSEFNMDEFIVEAVTIGRIRRLRIGHDGKGGGCGWFLDKTFHSLHVLLCRWLDRNEDDGQITRELVPFLDDLGYQIVVKTGDIPGGSSDSNVFVKLYGDKGDTDRMMLVVSTNNLGNYFEMGRVDIFTINRLMIGHTNKGMRAGWFLDSVQIVVPVHGKNYMFPSHRWLCKDEADGKTEVEIYPSEILEVEQLMNYEVTVVTGDVMFAGTNARVFIQIYGEKGKTETITLENRSNNFERNTTEIFKVLTLYFYYVGKIFKIRIGHDGSGIGSGWFLESVDMQEVVLPYRFPCSRWLSSGEEDGELVVELLPEDADEDLEVNTYEVCVFTGDMMGAGTDAKVYINIYGENGDTGERLLRNSDNLNKFERGVSPVIVQEDVFIVTAIDLLTLKKLRIRHDNTEPHSSWYLDRVEIVDTKEDITYYFPCNRWLAVDEDDGQIARELVPVDEAFMRQDEDEEGTSATLGLEQKSMSTTYTLKIKTGEKKYAGTDANVFAILFGEKDDTGLINLKSCKNYKNKFEQGMINEFIVEAVDLGDLEKLRIGHDNSGGSSGWFLDWVEVDAPSQGQRLRFPCGRWLDPAEDDGAIVRDLYPADLQTEVYTPFVPYEIKIFTSDVFAAGTDADVFIVLYGQNGMCTLQKHLCVNERERRLYFERGAEDMFIVELEDIGDVIEKIRIGHDNRGTNPGWHLDRVEIRRQLRKGKGSETTIFPCERWLAKSEDDGETVRELVASDIITQKLLRDGTLKTTEMEVEDALETHGYKVSVRTGDMYGAGTDANVFLTIYGDLGDTGERKLAKSENNKNKFERGEVDRFTIEAVDLGQVFKIRIRHDNTMLGADWYLDQVEVQDEDTEEVYMFLCERWLSTKKEDKQIDRIFYIKVCLSQWIIFLVKFESDLVPHAVIPYHFTVSTGVDRDGSTTARVYVIVIGPNDAETDRLWLDLAEGKKCFAAGGMEHFVCYGADVGEIKRVELGHNGVTPESCWLVDELSVAVPTKGIKYIFPCKCWLAKDRGDGLTVRLFNVLDSSTINIIRKVIYSVSVVTGDTQYAGTDTNIFLTVYGANGSTEEMLLPKNGDRFERDQEDTFTLEIDDIAPLKKIRVRIDGTGSRPDWFLDRILMRNLTTEEEYLFTYENWLSKTKGPKRTKVCELPAVVDDEEMVEKTTYIIQVQTSDIGGGGTDANVFLIVFGEYGDTGMLPLKESTNRNKFERKMKDVFRFPDMLSLGELSKVRVWHDNKGPAPGWHLEYIEVKDEAMDQTFRFPCDRWLAKNDDDGQIIRELACANNESIDLSDKTKYEIATITANTGNASTSENAWIVLEGRKARSKEFVLENKKKKFLSGATDTFEFSSKHLGEIAGICLGHITKDGKKVKKEVFWHVLEVVVTENELGNKYFFHCDAQIPLAAKKDQFQTFECYKSIESFASKVRKLVPVKYEIIVITGDVKGAGTDTNVFITIYGVNGDSGRRHLRQKFRNLFERGQTDRFVMEMLDLGELLRVKVEHDGSNWNCGWFLECVEITNTANSVTTVFLCGKWLDANKSDGQIHRVLYPRY
uniref:Lipoxygenase homology domains 1b n=1 Tax=Xiphophorus couchianus TaxID=32473 RepID=A0A3B5LQZ1_9TELE